MMPDHRQFPRKHLYNWGLDSLRWTISSRAPMTSWLRPPTRPVNLGAGDRRNLIFAGSFRPNSESRRLSSSASIRLSWS